MSWNRRLLTTINYISMNRNIIRRYISNNQHFKKITTIPNNTKAGEIVNYNNNFIKIDKIKYNKIFSNLYIMSELDKEQKINEVTQIVITKLNKKHFSSNQIIFVCGPMGSGKTTYIKHNLLKSKKYYYHNIDELIPYFLDMESDPRKMYQLCRSVGIKITDYLLENNISMIIEGTGRNMEIVDYLKRLKQNGYNVKTIFIKTSLETCRDRIKIRNKKQDHQVLDEDVIEYYNILWEQNNNMSKIISQISNDVEFVDNYSTD